MTKRADIISQISELEQIDILQLKDKYRVTFNTEPPLLNKSFLVKKLAYHIQEKVYGGISEKVKSRMDEILMESGFNKYGLSDFSEESDFSEKSKKQEHLKNSDFLENSNFFESSNKTKNTEKSIKEENPKVSKKPQVSMISIPGTKFTRIWKKEKHEAIALEDGFEYKGIKYKSLSAVARQITGTQWNGPLFFGLRKKV